MKSRSRSVAMAVVACALLVGAVSASSALGSAGQPWGHAKESWRVEETPLKSGQVEPFKPFLRAGGAINFKWDVYGAGPVNWSCSGVTNYRQSIEAPTSQLEYGGKGSAWIAFTGCAFTTVSNCQIRSTEGLAAAAPGEIMINPLSFHLTGATTAALSVKSGETFTTLEISRSGAPACGIAGRYRVLSENRATPPTISGQISNEYEEKKKQPFTITGSNLVSFDPMTVSGEILMELG